MNVVFLSYFAIAGVVAVLTILGSVALYAQDYPNKPVRIVAPEAGGAGDFLVRIIAQALSENVAQPVIVDNRASNVLGSILAKSSPDGYTLLLEGNTIWIRPLLQETPYDPVRDFSPITLVGRSPYILVVNPSLAANSVKELIALAKAKPGQLTYGSSGTGSSSHLPAELFKAMAGVDIRHIPYKGNGPVLIALISGEVHLNFAGASGVLPHIKSGKLRALAITSPRPFALLPGLVPLATTVPGYEAGSTYGMFGPGKTLPTIINRLNQEFVRVFNRTDVKEKFSAAGVEVVTSSPEQFGATLKSDMARFEKVIKDAGIRAE